ncbi:YlxR family protein [Propionimicrobium sp. PCR01-08-3]|uniref:YlxR family protein n=1 Tax=Propionimicrobium sp. PCR01-08-3 TaxID=3052086 RepID=UPI00255CA261|nr:YlxR family protein [Propionimicrobium sp. PCR01-08-3]WIY81580.1 YlxR family protein [Propionimicrobium sp. PCR01-08-3]
MPERTCVACHKVCDQSELVRFVLVGSVVTIDANRRLPGRGAWLHADADCVSLAKRRGAFARSFRRKVDDSVLDSW